MSAAESRAYWVPRSARGEVSPALVLGAIMAQHYDRGTVAAILRWFDEDYTALSHTDWIAAARLIESTDVSLAELVAVAEARFAGLRRALPAGRKEDAP